jgi:mannan endo-1,4-beta-mannosidase
MARGVSRRLAILTIVAAIGILLTAGVGPASGMVQSDKARSKAPTRAMIHVARKVGTAIRCANRRQKRLRRTLRRRRCRRPAVASSDPQPLYWGATIGSHLTGTQAPWDMGAVARFEELAQKPVSLVQFFQPFADCSAAPCSFYGFPTTPMENVRHHSAIPVLSWSSQSIPSSLDQPDFQLSDLIEGRYDAYIARFAEETRGWGHPFFLRFNWEMNGGWFQWSEGVNGNSAGQSVAAWRHVHDIFAAVGAANATWVWCPYVDPNGTLASVGSQYPGDAYVDWTCLDGYNWGTNPAAPKGWRSFDQLFRSSYDEIAERIAPSKPMMIGEVGSTEQGGSKAAWIEDMLAAVPAAYPRVRAMLWLDKFDSGMDWPLATSGTAAAAFADGIRSTVYVPNAFGGLGPEAIQPPS